MLLAPFHAAAISVVLDKLERSQAVIAVYANERDFQFAASLCRIFRGRLSDIGCGLSLGTAGRSNSSDCLPSRIGLPTPSYSIRLPATEREANGLIPGIEQIVREETARREGILREIRSRPVKKCGRICVVAPSAFRLWGDNGHALATALRDEANAEFVRFDPDDPANSSPLALASAVSECEALVTANLGRADFPNVVTEDVAWVTWVTTPRVPAAVREQDGLVLADETWRANARAAGWKDSQVAIGGWPGMQVNRAGEAIAIIADTRVVPMKREGFEYSSHGLLWSAIAGELIENPFALSETIENYLSKRMKQFSIREEGFDRARFIDELIVPAYQQGVARALVKNGVAIELHGRGWGEVGGLEKFARGAVETREGLSEIFSRASVLVNCLPVGFAHPIESAGVRVVRVFGKTRDAFLRDVSSAKIEATSQRTAAMSTATVLGLIRR